jgi:hypothetical protein
VKDDGARRRDAVIEVFKETTIGELECRHPRSVNLK